MTSDGQQPSVSSDKDEPETLKQDIETSSFVKTTNLKRPVEKSSRELLSITEDDDFFSNIAFVDIEGEIVHRRLGFRRARNYNNVDRKTVKYEKSEEEKNNIRKALRENQFLENILVKNKLEEFIEAMVPREVAVEHIIVQQGEEGEDMFVSESGTFEVIVNGKLDSTFSDHRVFGELAILYNNPRQATIRAMTHCKLWVLHAPFVQKIVMQNAIEEEEMRMIYLKKVPLFKNATDLKLRKIANLFKVDFFKTNTKIVTEGEQSDDFYIIKAGHATATRLGIFVAVLNKGDFFGEEALLRVLPRKDTITANAPGIECLYLSRIDFSEHLGEVDEFMSKHDTPSVEQSISILREYEDSKIEDFDTLNILGEGAFGRVILAEAKKYNMLFAMKIVKKYIVDDSVGREHVNNETNIQIHCRSNFIIRMYNTYQDTKYVYFLMECCLGGDLFDLLARNNFRGLEEKSVKFYAGCVVEALEYLHAQNFVYRDLKPENILLDANGYAKLTDFGFAKHLPDGERTYTHAGTLEYVCPEIILDRGHGKAADSWSFGVFIFELLVGRTPFRRDNDINTYNAIIKGIDKIIFPPYVGHQAISLIRGLCKFFPSQRAGSKKKGMNEIRNHRWYSNFNWKKLQIQKMKPPLVPILKSVTDTNHLKSVYSTEAPDTKMWDDF